MQVVSAGSGSVITMWMIETGQKVKQVHKPIAESRITRTELQAHIDKHISSFLRNCGAASVEIWFYPKRVDKTEITTVKDLES